MEALIKADQVAPDISSLISTNLTEAADLFALGVGALVPFPVRKLSNPSVVWVNWSWFGSLEVDTTCQETRHSIKQWITDSFAYCVYDDAAPSAFLPEQAVFYADRYGCGAGTGPHGGSGRVATVGRFQVKGIGPTPLTAGVSQESYSNGCLWLEEGIREAILSEVADAEFPHGAVPIIAIIETGIPRLVASAGAEPRALAIRPAVMRPAHLERASLFASRASKGDVSQDIDRTRAAHAAMNALPADRDRLYITVKSFSEFIRRAMDQVAFGHVHRLFHGGYFSSNLSINGELHDYGSFRSLPDWRLSQATSESIPFGHEAVFLHSITKSFEFYGKKYGAAEDTLSAPSLECINAEIKVRRMQGFSMLFGLAPGTSQGSRVAALLDGYFSSQQKELRDFEASPRILSTWIYDLMAPDQMTVANQSQESAVLGEIRKLLGEDQSNDGASRVDQRAAWNQARRLLHPRPFLFREILQRLIFQTLAAGSSDIEDAVLSVFNYALTTSRRVWSDFDGAEIAAQAVNVDGAALLLRHPDGRFNVAVEGIVSGARFFSFGQSISNLHADLIHSTRGRRFRIFETADDPFQPFTVFCTYGEALHIPAMGFQYFDK